MKTSTLFKISVRNYEIKKVYFIKIISPVNNIIDNFLTVLRNLRMDYI